MTETLTQAIIVLHPFHAFKKGDIIRDAVAMAEIKTAVLPTNFVVASIPIAAAPVEKTL